MLISFIGDNGTSAWSGDGNVTFWSKTSSLSGHLEAKEKSADGEDAMGEYTAGHGDGMLCISPNGLSTGQLILGLCGTFLLKSDIVKVRWCRRD